MRSYRLNGEVYMTAPDRRAFMAATAASFATPAALGAKECPSAGMDWITMSLEARNLAYNNVEHGAVRPALLRGDEVALWPQWQPQSL
jgi:hypothetical protein